MDATTNPTTLLEAVRYFGQPGIALEFMKKLRWPNGITCPKCGDPEESVIFMANVQRWKCRGCKKQFSVKVGTIMEDSPISLDKWLCGIWMISNCKNGVSSWEIHRALGITQKSAWFMLHRIRLAMNDGAAMSPFSGSGPFEADETYVGGKTTNMKKSVRKALGTRRNRENKAIVMGILERGGSVRANVIGDNKGPTVRAEVRRHINPGSKVFSDSLGSYRGLDREYVHDTINHVETYVRGEVHTNGIENFWALLKRTIHGTYVNVDAAHLNAYVAEQVFRFNERKLNDGQRAVMVASNVAGKRITYEELIARGQEAR